MRRKLRFANLPRRTGTRPAGLTANLRSVLRQSGGGKPTGWRGGVRAPAPPAIGTVRGLHRRRPARGQAGISVDADETLAPGEQRERGSTVLFVDEGSGLLPGRRSCVAFTRPRGFHTEDRKSTRLNSSH